MFSWNSVEAVFKNEKKISGYLSHVLSSIKVRFQENRENDFLLSLIVPNFIVKEICEREIQVEICKIIKNDFNKDVAFEYTIESTQQSFPLEEAVFVEAPEGLAETVVAAVVPPVTFQFKEKYSLNPRMTFNSLILTQENSFSKQALDFFIEDTVTMCASLFGPSGVGKTHMLHAVGWAILAQKPNTKIKVVSGEEFLNDFQTAIFSKTMGDFRNKYRFKTDVLLIDDLQTLEKAKATQLELFNLFNDFSLSNKKIVITSDKKFSELFGFDDRLKSRFSGGLVLNLEHPSSDSKSKFLDHKLLNHNISLAQHLKDVVLDSVGRCYRSIEGAVSRIEMLNRLNGRVEDDVVFKMFPVVNKRLSTSMSVESIIQEVVARHRLQKSDLLGPSRKKEIFEARKEAITIIRENLKLSLKDIGVIFNRDHTSIMNALKGSSAQLKQTLS